MTLEHPEWFLSLRRLLFVLASIGFAVAVLDSNPMRNAWITTIVALAPMWTTKPRLRLLFVLALIAFVVTAEDSDPVRYAWIAASVALAQMWTTNPLLTVDFLQANNKKILFKELESAKLFLGMLWLFDTRGDYVCISPWIYDKKQVSEVFARLRDLK
jgi:hypothetical protein